MKVPPAQGVQSIAVVIPSGSKGDRAAGSLGVKALWGWGDPVRSDVGGRATWQAAAEANQEAPKCVPRVKRIAGVSGVPSRSERGEGHVDVGELDHDEHRTPRGHRERHVRKEWSAKARNHSRVATALPHSKGTAYKPSYGEITVCPRVGRMGPNK